MSPRCRMAFLDTLSGATVNSRRVMIGRRRFRATLLLAYCGDCCSGTTCRWAAASDLDVGVNTIQRPAAVTAERAAGDSPC